MLPTETNILKNEVEVLKEKTGQFTTLDLNNEDNKIKLYNSLQSCDVKLIDIKNQVIEVSDIYIKRTNVQDKDENDNPIINEVTGEVKTKGHFLSILYGSDGTSYVSSAYGIYNSLVTITSIFGMPSNEKPIKLKVAGKQMRNGKGESLILLVVNDNEPSVS